METRMENPKEAGCSEESLVVVGNKRTSRGAGKYYLECKVQGVVVRLVSSEFRAT